MPPKEKLSTRRQAREAGLTLSWSRELGEGVAVDQQVVDHQQQEVAQQLPQVSGAEDQTTIQQEAGKNSSEEEQEWDHTADLSSPLKDDSDLLDLSIGSVDSESTLRATLPDLNLERSWSVSVNRLEADTLENITPERLPPRSRLFGESGSESSTPETPPRLETVPEEPDDFESEENLETVQERRAEIDRVLERLELLAELPGVIDVDIEEPVVNLVAKMDEDAYKTRSRVFKDKLRELEHAIKDFTVEDVVDIEADHHTAPLEEANTKFNTFRQGLWNFYDEFDRDEHSEWEEEWEGKLDALHLKLKVNEREVRAKWSP